MPYVYMNVTSSNPNRHLHAGKTYRVNDEEAKELTAPRSGADDKPAAKIVPKPAKPSPITVPDPGETAVDDEHEEDDAE